jgi:hypothetical protein
VTFPAETCNTTEILADMGGVIREKTPVLRPFPRVDGIGAFIFREFVATGMLGVIRIFPRICHETHGSIEPCGFLQHVDLGQPSVAWIRHQSVLIRCCF